jgi:hypothetical protein
MKSNDMQEVDYLLYKCMIYRPYTQHDMALVYRHAVDGPFEQLKIQLPIRLDEPTTN